MIPTVENVGDRFIEPLCEQIEKTIDIDRLLEIARSVPPVRIESVEPGLFPNNPISPTVNIAYAWDEAFSFYYQDNLDLLEAYGARLMPFSPLDDVALPLDTQGVYIGGGFPEIYAERLSKNQTMLDSLREAAKNCIPIYGECGGLMYLSQGITNFEGNRYQMVGLVPCESIMKNKLTRMGYIQIETLQDTILSPKGNRFRGHEFHWSEMESEPNFPAYRVVHPRTGNEGFVSGSVLASYVHLHFGTDPNLARNFIAACRQWVSAR